MRPSKFFAFLIILALVAAPIAIVLPQDDGGAVTEPSTSDDKSSEDSSEKTEESDRSSDDEEEQPQNTEQEAPANNAEGDGDEESDEADATPEASDDEIDNTDTTPEPTNDETDDTDATPEATDDETDDPDATPEPTDSETDDPDTTPEPTNDETDDPDATPEPTNDETDDTDATTEATDDETDDTDATPEAEITEEVGEETGNVTPDPEVTEEPTVALTPAPETTEEANFEATEEVDFEVTEEPEATVEVTPEVEPQTAILTISHACTVDGTLFTIHNSGDAMPEARSYEIDGETMSSFQLETDEAIEINAGYGLPTLTSGDMSSAPESSCEAPGRITGVVWNDANSDGIVDESEPGLSGITIVLAAGEAEPPLSITTAEDGSYSFDALAAGIYTVSVDIATLPANLDSENSAQVEVTLAGDEAVVNFGYSARPTGSISGVIWQDTDGDGAQSDGETGLAGIAVSVVDGSGVEIAVLTSDDSGTYAIDKLAADTYTLTTASLPEGATITFDPDGTTDGTTKITVETGAMIENVNFGVMPRLRGSISGVIWQDTNGNSAQSDGETGLAAVPITLNSDSGELIQTITGENGGYTFADLEAGNYTITVTEPPANHQPTADLDGTADHMTTVTLAQGEAREGLSFGYQPRTGQVLSGRVWVDLDGDGVQTENEPGQPGVLVSLTDDAGEVVAQATSDVHGAYAVEGLLPGDYTVSLSEVPEGLTALTGEMTVGITDADANLNFVYQPVASTTISGTVWLETADYGTRESGEGGLRGVTVELLNSESQIVDTFNVEANGRFEFIDLVAGTYSVHVNGTALPAQVFPTYDIDGDLDFSTTVILVWGEVLAGINFGVVGTY